MWCSRAIPDMAGWRVSPRAVLLVMAAVLAPPAAWPQAQQGAAQSVEAGSRVFFGKGCFNCHAVHGRGGTVGPDLALIPGRRSFFHLAAALWNHLPQMQREMSQRGVQRPRLTPREAADLTAFLFWLDYFDEPGDTARGARLFRSRQCMICHQVRGLGGVVGPDLSILAGSRTPIMIAAGMWNHAPDMTAAMQARGIRRPSFTGPELRDLLAYMEGPSSGVPSEPMYVMPGQASRGRQVFEGKSCIRCHGASEGEGRRGPDLGAEGRYASVLDFAAAMWNKGPRMLEAMREIGAEVPQLRPDEMADLVAYLYAGRYFGDAGDATRGEELVRTRGCQQCHGARMPAGDLAAARGLDSPAAIVAALWNHLGASLPLGGRWPTLRAQDVADVAAYLQAAGGTQ